MAPSDGKPIPFNPARHPPPSPLRALRRLAPTLDFPAAPPAGRVLRWLPVGLAGALLLTALSLGLHMELARSPAPATWGAFESPACEWSTPVPWQGRCFGERPPGYTVRLLGRAGIRWLVRDPLTDNVAYVDLWTLRRGSAWPGAGWAAFRGAACEWSAPVAPARCFGRRDAGFSVRVIRPAGARLLVWDPWTRDVAYVDAAALQGWPGLSPASGDGYAWPADPPRTVANNCSILGA